MIKMLMMMMMMIKMEIMMSALCLLAEIYGYRYRSVSY